MQGELPPHPFFALFGDDPLAAAASVRAAGKWSELRLGPMRAICIADAELANTVFTSQRAKLDTIMPVVEPRLHAIVGEGLLGASGEDWKLLRSIVTPEFSRSRFASFHAIVARHADALVDGWREKAQRDGYVEVAFDEELGEVAQAVTLEIVFGHPPTPAERDFYRTLVRYVAEVGDAPPAIDPVAAVAEFAERISSVRSKLADAVGAMQSDEGLYRRLTVARDESGQALSPNQVRDTILSVLLAGIVDVKWAFAFLAHDLATHGAWQRVVRDEVDLVAREEGRAGLDDTPCLRASTNESLRRFPTSMLVSGMANTRIEVDDILLEPRDIVFVVLPAIFRDPEIWARADDFVPQRFLRPGMELRKIGFTPFGMGMRACVGAGLAMLEIQTTMAAILRTFELEACAPACSLSGRVGQLVAREPVRIRARLLQH